MTDLPAAGGKPRYSRAFERLVLDDEDNVGLLAYALFKRAVPEAAQRGEAVSGIGRDPSPTEIKTYRHLAESIIGEAIERSLRENLAELQQSAALNAIRTATIELRAHIDLRTNFRSALLTNIIAWIVTLAITVAIVWLLGSPDPARLVAETARSAVGAVQP